MTYIETDYTPHQNFIELGPQALKWDAGKPFILHRRQLHEAKQVILGGNTYYEVKKKHSKWLVRIA